MPEDGTIILYGTDLLQLEDQRRLWDRLNCSPSQKRVISTSQIAYALAHDRGVRCCALLPVKHVVQRCIFNCALPNPGM